MLKIKGRIATKVSSTGKLKVVSNYNGSRQGEKGLATSAPFVETASLGFPGSGSSKNNLSISTIGSSQRNNLDLMLTGIMEDTLDHQLYKFYRDIYHYDPIAGSAVDLQCALPFSDFDLVGSDKKKIATYTSAIERLNFRSMNRFVSMNYMVYGVFSGTIIYNRQRKIFTDLLPYEIEDCSFQHMPFASMNPVITVQPNAVLKNFLSSDEEAVIKLRKQLPASMLDVMNQGHFVLDPLTTLYFARRGMDSYKPISYYRRILPLYLLEKILLRGTLVEAGKRQRSLMHVQCLAGNTLISTGSGTVRLDSVVEHDINEKPFSVNINMPVRGYDGKMHNATKWHYKGKKETLAVTTESGRTINCTSDHKVQVLSNTGKLIWVEAKNLKDELVCISISGAIGSDDTGLLEKLVEISSCSKEISKDVDLLVRCKYKFERVVSIEGSGLKPVYDLSMEKGSRNSFVANSIVVHNCGDEQWEPTAEELNAIVALFQQADLDPLGPIIATRQSIQTSEARCISGDTLISTSEGLKRISDMVPHSPKQLKEGASFSTDLKVKNHTGEFVSVDKWWYQGYKPTIKLTTSTGTHLVCTENHRMLTVRNGKLAFINAGNIEIGKTWVLKEQNEVTQNNDLALNLGMPDTEYIKANSFGIPTEIFTSVLKDRHIGSSKGNLCNENGTWFINDDNEEILVKDCWTETFKPFLYLSSTIYPECSSHFLYDPEARSCFLYENYASGAYDKHLAIIKQVSASLYNTLIELFSLQLNFEKVVSVKEYGMQHVYDLTMNYKESAPMFVANSLVTHNSGGDFWKYTDVIDQTSNLKMRALGLSDALMSNEGNYNTAEAALSTFIDGMKSYRDYYTQCMFYDRLFPVIAAVNGFKNPEKSEAHFDAQRSASLGFQVNDASNYEIPTVRWHKSLEPNNDANTMEMLNTLSEKGFPIPLRMWAAAGGLRIENIENEMDEDIKLRKSFMDYNEKIMKMQAQQEQTAGGGDYDESSSGGDVDYENGDTEDVYDDMNSESASLAKELGRLQDMARLQPRPLLSRNFENGENEVVGRTKTGKKKYVHNQKAAVQKQNEDISKAARELLRKKHR